MEDAGRFWKLPWNMLLKMLEDAMEDVIEDAGRCWKMPFTMLEDAGGCRPHDAKADPGDAGRVTTGIDGCTGALFEPK